MCFLFFKIIKNLGENLSYIPDSCTSFPHVDYLSFYPSSKYYRSHWCGNCKAHLSDELIQFRNLQYTDEYAFHL